MGPLRRAHRPDRLAVARARGFTLIEMLVSLAILTIIAVIVLTSHASFTNSLIVTNAAYDVALSLRQAESFGVSSRNSGAIANAGYGIDFSTANLSSYVLFVDNHPNNCGPGSLPSCKPGNGVYNAGADGLVSTYTINAGIGVSKLCVYRGGSSYCSGGGSNLFALDIVFTRPNTAANIAFLKNAALYPGDQGPGDPLTGACITLSTPDGTSQRGISVSSVGQVSPVASCP
ncbi:MAG TPA: prepilin-type N-terminal cleavage/methylation domain-containing protein [Candidatus Paceibacterota bacterium]|nr:prepilin-type N-terminal cleavage/methylation domain-containing protein [Candidatus Paceibacterota bacterium]